MKVWRKRNLCVLLAGCNLVQSMWKKVWIFPSKLKNRTTICYRNFTSRHLSENTNLKRSIYPHVHCRTTYYGQVMEATYMPICKQVKKMWRMESRWWSRKMETHGSSQLGHLPGSGGGPGTPQGTGWTPTRLGKRWGGKRRMKSGDRMEPAPTEGWLGEGKSSKTWRGPFTVRRAADTERDL